MGTPSLCKRVSQKWREQCFHIITLSGSTELHKQEVRLDSIVDHFSARPPRPGSLPRPPHATRLPAGAPHLSTRAAPRRCPPPPPSFGGILSACARHWGRRRRLPPRGKATMDASGKPQILEHICKSLTITIYETKWIPSSARFVTLGGYARGTGAIQVRREQRSGRGTGGRGSSPLLLHPPTSRPTPPAPPAPSLDSRFDGAGAIRGGAFQLPLAICLSFECPTPFPLTIPLPDTPPAPCSSPPPPAPSYRYPLSCTSWRDQTLSCRHVGAA